MVKSTTWTGFANAEKDFADAFVDQKIQSYTIEDEAPMLDATIVTLQSAFKVITTRDGNLITGQQQYSGAAVAWKVDSTPGR